MSDSWVKWEVPRWWGSDARTELSIPARAIYLELLFHCLWNGSVPDDERQLASKAAVPLSDFRKAWPSIKGKFVTENGRLINLVAAENADLRLNRDPQKVAAGRKGGLAKASKVLEKPLAEVVAEVLEPEPSTLLDREEREEKREKEELPHTPSPNGSGESVQPKEPKPERDPLNASQRDWFDGNFYPDYPRKKDPRIARTVFGRRVRTLAQWQRCQILLARYIREVAGKDPKYTKHPGPWLNAQDFDRDLPVDGPAMQAPQPAAAAMDEWVPPDFGERDEDYDFAFEQD